MTLNCELCQSEFSVLYHKRQAYIIKLSKICFLYTYVDQVIIQQKFNVLFQLQFYNIFTIMFFPLFSKIFTDILKIYELLYLKYIIKNLNITKHLTVILAIIMYQANSMSQFHQAFELYPY